VLGSPRPCLQAGTASAGEQQPAELGKARDEIAAAIMEHGWADEAGAFTGAFGSHHLDAAVLLMPVVGFSPASDPRFRRTMETVRRELGDDGLLQRWTGAEEGAFVICSYWLAECLALAARSIAPGRCSTVSAPAPMMLGCCPSRWTPHPGSC
jgi:GH15 family glucan-1,4-alpha-glucosidase